MSEKLYLSPAEAASYTGLSLATIHRYLTAGTISKVQPGGFRHRVLILRTSLENLHTGSEKLPRDSSIAGSKSYETAVAVNQTVRRSGPTPRWLKNQTTNQG